MYLEITEEQRDVGTTELIEISRKSEPRPFLWWRFARRETARERERVETDVFLSQEDKRDQDMRLSARGFIEVGQDRALTKLVEICEHSLGFGKTDGPEAMLM